MYKRNQKVDSGTAKRTLARMKRTGFSAGINTADGISGAEARAVKSAAHAHKVGVATPGAGLYKRTRYKKRQRVDSATANRTLARMKTTGFSAGINTKDGISGAEARTVKKAKKAGRNVFGLTYKRPPGQGR